MTLINTAFPIRWRSIVSKNLIFCSIGLTFSGVVLFLTPSGWIARETAWTFLGFSKDQWQSLHNWTSIWFLILSVFHILLNWKAIQLYFSTRYQNLRSGWKETVSALVIFIGLIWISVSFWGPADWLNEQRESFRHELPGNPVNPIQPANHSSDSMPATSFKPEEKHGETGTGNRELSGYGFGELTLAGWCTENQIPLETAIDRLKKAGIEADEGASLKSIADESGYRPGQLIRIISGQGSGKGKNRRISDF